MGTDPGDLAVGSYARYTESNISLTYLAGYRSLGPTDPSQQYQVWFWGNESYRTYDFFAVSWAIERVLASDYLVNYTISLGDYGGHIGRTLNLSAAVLVSRSNNSVFSETGTSLGTWPYWLASPYLVPGASLVLIHDYPQNVIGVGSGDPVENFSEHAFTSLPEGDGEPNITATSDFLDSWLHLGIGDFRTDRLLVTYPYFHEISDTGISVSGPSSGFTISTSNAIWVGVYDRVTGIMLAQDHNNYFVDDVMLHSLGLWQIGFNALSLVLSSTNVKIAPDSATPILTTLLVAAGVVSVLAVAAVFTLLWRTHGKMTKSGARA